MARPFGRRRPFGRVAALAATKRLKTGDKIPLKRQKVENPTLSRTQLERGRSKFLPPLDLNWRADNDFPSI